MSKSFLNDKTKSRGIRNNNPGNIVRSSIRWQGKITPSADSRFEQFIDMNSGIRAMTTDIVNDITIKGLNTLEKLVSVYAPPSENDTTAYISRVAIDTGLKRNETIRLTPELLFKIIRSKINVENGRDAVLITDKDIIDGIYSVNDSTAKRAGIQKKKTQ